MSVAELIGVGGPGVAVAVALGYFLNYLIKRRTTESGVVETTAATLAVVRDQQKDMADTLKGLRAENEDLRRQLRIKDDQVEKLRDDSKDLSQHIALLERENTELRARLERLEGSRK